MIILAGLVSTSLFGLSTSLFREAAPMKKNAPYIALHRTALRSLYLQSATPLPTSCGGTGIPAMAWDERRPHLEGSWQPRFGNKTRSVVTAIERQQSTVT